MPTVTSGSDRPSRFDAGGCRRAGLWVPFDVDDQRVMTCGRPPARRPPERGPEWRTHPRTTPWSRARTAEDVAHAPILTRRPDNGAAKNPQAPLSETSA